VQIATSVGQVACWNPGIWIDIRIGIKELTKECWPSSMLEPGRYMDWYWSSYQRTDQRVLGQAACWNPGTALGIKETDQTGMGRGNTGLGPVHSCLAAT
jgi:hypothetical protein